MSTPFNIQSTQKPDESFIIRSSIHIRFSLVCLPEVVDGDSGLNAAVNRGVAGPGKYHHP